MRAVALLSGGLDSTLAVKVILEQGIEVYALNFSSVFCTCTPKTSGCSAAQNAVRQLGVELKVMNASEDMIEIVKSPKHGYGSNLNPCIDCRIMKFRIGHEYMLEIGASFIITGEVVGQRPMSQRRRAMELVEKESGLEGLILRPLSAQLLEPSIPEKEGWVDREKLLGIQGRSRKPQIALAEAYGINDYPCPAGGCRLTEPGFAARLRDLMKFKPDFNVHDATLLKFGRHFRLSPQTKAIVGRDEVENDALQALSRDEDVLLEAVDFAGPLTLVYGQADDEAVQQAAALTAKYSKGAEQDSVKIAVLKKDGTVTAQLQVAPLDEERLSQLMVTRPKKGGHKQDCADSSCKEPS